MAVRAGYFKYALDAVSISSAFADGHGHSSGGDGGSSHNSGGDSSSSSGSSSSGGTSYSGSGGGGDGSSSSGSSRSGGDGSSGSGGNSYGSGNNYSGSGSGSGSQRGDDGGTGYSYNGSGSGYSYSGYGGGGAVPHGDGRPPSVGMPQPELTGLPKDLGLDATKDDKTWESLLNQHFDTHSGVKEAERIPDGKGFESSGGDRQKASPPVKGGGPQPAGGNTSTAAIVPGSYSPTEVLAANLSPAGLARAQALGFQVGGSPGPGGPGPSGPGQGLGRGPGGTGGVTIMTVPHGLDAAQAMRLLEQNLPGENFQLNRLYHLYQPAMKEDAEGHLASPATLGGKKCSGDRCYAQTAIQWKDRLSSCARNAKIGVIDTGFDMHHPAFKGQKITPKAFVPEGKSAAATWHGTGVLALLAGRPDSGTPGLVPDATYHAASIFYADESGGTVTDTVSFLKALDWMSESGVKLVNMSFTGPRDDLVRRKIESLSAKGVVFAAAAGNDGPTAEPAYPAAYPQVIAVTAVTKDLRNYPYANRGEHIDIAAPGVDIWTAWPEAREGYRSGTSFASPFVTGVLAIYPPDVLRGPKNNLLEHVNITDLGPPGRDPIYGRGLLQAPATCQGNSSEVAELSPVGR